MRSRIPVHGFRAALQSKKRPRRIARQGPGYLGGIPAARLASNPHQWHRVQAIGVPRATVCPRSVRWAKARERTVPVLVLRLVPP